MKNKYFCKCIFTILNNNVKYYLFVVICFNKETYMYEYIFPLHYFLVLIYLS